MILPYVAGLLSTVISFKIGKRQNKANADATEIENIRSSLTVYQGIIDDLTQRLMQANENVKKLEEELDQLQKRLNDFKAR